MKKADIIDFTQYRNSKLLSPAIKNAEISDELKMAIKHLIHRLRETGPLK